ncbi:hypothetical protein BT96DRAFT_914139 [Gymnopus androsaceus JB14]|uniref:Tethering factor for nuclear proteasome STS1 n=1 Tax=Gymnopus androsaceus JB14 TaxID=1447944 RepID=A0A6A4IFZ6_9AGAR|nr:hypothetical protein BT96DRAFT_914139 [Gymnopus androsaceus JB14]
MANVLSSSIGFHPRSSKDAPGFGFGLGSSSMQPSWTSSSPFQSAQSSALNQLAATSLFNNTAPRAQKRRHEPEDSENYPQDEVMDRSPTPERPKRGPPKRLRTAPSSDSVTKEDNSSRESRAREDKDVDIGVLLATLPPQSLLPILTSLIKAHPSLKSAILPLIPRPTVETATQALADSSKKLREAYPYSNNAPFSQPSSSSSYFGFGFGNAPTNASSGGMRESYIQSRLRPHINEFVSTCNSYLPYFSYTSASSQSALSAQNRSHPTEVFIFLCNLTGHVLSQPPLAQNGLEPLLLSRLSEEWHAWDGSQGGMFGSDTVRNWEQRLDEFAAKDSDFGQTMRGIRDQWISRVGWLVGRTIQQPMES